MTHPNAATAAALTLPTVLIVWLAGHTGIDLSAEAAAGIGGGVITVALFVGRRGIKGVARLLWRGDPDL